MLVQVQLSGKVSSQYLTALLMAAPLATGSEGIDIQITDELVSQPYVAMTIKLMERFGVNVCQQCTFYEVLAWVVTQILHCMLSCMCPSSMLWRGDCKALVGSFCKLTTGGYTDANSTASLTLTGRAVRWAAAYAHSTWPAVPFTRRSVC